MTRPAALALIFILAAASPTLAHPLVGQGASLAAGLSHPFGGLDHLIAMFAVGLWAARLGGRALWAVPLAFVAAMLAGFALALAGVPLPLVEPAILASVVVLGLLVAMSSALPAPIAVALVALFAVAHGHAHGTEFTSAPFSSATLGFAAGFAISTAALHAAGIVTGRLLGALPAGAFGRGAIRTLGFAIVLVGAAMAIG